MLYQLPNGKVIEISTEQYLDMSDEDFEYLVAFNYGEVQENPWFGSVLSKKDTSEDKPNAVNELIDTPEDDELDIDPALLED
jgi:hypothetical protein